MLGVSGPEKVVTSDNKLGKFGGSTTSFSTNNSYTEKEEPTGNLYHAAHAQGKTG